MKSNCFLNTEPNIFTTINKIKFLSGASLHRKSHKSKEKTEQKRSLRMKSDIPKKCESPTADVVTGWIT